jgi:anti-sigma-K factor RskA
MTNNQCDRLMDYFNNSLSEREKAEFELHIQSCTQCREELHELEHLTADLPFLSQPVTPPADLEARVFERVLGESEERDTEEVRKPKKNKARWLVPLAAALTISLAGNAYLYSELGQKQGPVNTQKASVDKVLQYVALAPVEGTAEGTASIVEQDGTRSIIIQAAELQALKDEEVYQVWLIKDEQPERAGTFVASDDGKGSVVFQLDKENLSQKWDTVAITLEPNANSETPKGSMVLASEL